MAMEHGRFRSASNRQPRHLVQDLEGNFSPALKWLAHHKDPRLVSHGVVMTFADLLWNRVASY
jgi:hypothetical protein